jgi:mRNA interferase MazF
MKRGDVFIVSPPGEFGKPRPAVVAQSSEINSSDVASVIVCPITGYIENTPLFRVPLEPSSENGLSKSSQIMVDQVQAISINRIGSRIGKISRDQTNQMNRTLAFVLGLD